MGEVFAGRYELVDPLASGGAGVIWRVWDLRENEYRAGKVLKQSDSASLLRFMRETSWRISHPHVVKPLGWVGEDDRVMFTMPIVRGGSLSALIRRHGPLPPAWATAAADQLLDALEVVHAQGLVHRDLKPANVLLQPSAVGAQPNVLLTDFGIAAPIGEPRMTRVTEVIGTPGYMSPEATYGFDPDPKQDLYSLGVVLLEMLSGQRPRKEGKPTIPPAAADTPLGRVISRLLADEEERWTTATEVREAIKGIELPNLKAKPVEVTDIIPELPEGWRENGPVGGRPGAPASAAETPTVTRPASEVARLLQSPQSGPQSRPSAVQVPQPMGPQPMGSASGPQSMPSASGPWETGMGVPQVPMPMGPMTGPMAPMPGPMGAPMPPRPNSWWWVRTVHPALWTLLACSFLFLLYALIATA